MQIKALLLLLMFLNFFLVTGCFNSNPPQTAGEHITITDSIGRQVSIPRQITKAVVSNRYNMEIIKSIGASDKVIGVDYGIYQDQTAYGAFFDSNQVIGKTQNELNYEKIIELNPQLLVITSNGSWQDADKKLAPFGIKTVVMDAYYTSKFADTYTLAGKIFNKEPEAAAFIDYFQTKLQYIQTALKDIPKKTVYFEYKKSGTTTVPGDYFFDMLEYAQADNIFKTAKSTEIDIEAVVQKNPDVIIKVGAAGVDPQYIPPTAAEFQKCKEALRSRPGWETVTAVKNDQILLLSQYVHGGASKLVGTMYIAKFLYPEYLPELHPELVFKDWVTKYQQLDYLPGHTYPSLSLTD